MLEIFENFGQIMIKAEHETAREGKNFFLSLVKELSSFDSIIIEETLEQAL